MSRIIQKKPPLTESTYYVLLVLQNQMHGYGVIKEVETLTKGRLILTAGTLYGVIQNLVKCEHIYMVNEEKSNKGKKEYVITKSGMKVLNYEVKRLRELIKNSNKIKDIFEKTEGNNLL